MENESNAGNTGLPEEVAKAQDLLDELEAEVGAEMEAEAGVVAEGQSASRLPSEEEGVAAGPAEEPDTHGSPGAGVAVGRIVHFRTADGSTRAGLIVKVLKGEGATAAGRVVLAVFMAGHHDGMAAECAPIVVDSRYSEAGVTGTWSWPPRS